MMCSLGLYLLGAAEEDTSAYSRRLIRPAFKLTTTQFRPVLTAFLGAEQTADGEPDCEDHGEFPAVSISATSYGDAVDQNNL